MIDLPVVIETRCKVDQSLLFMVVFRLVENQVQLLATHKVFQLSSFHFIEYIHVNYDGYIEAYTVPTRLKFKRACETTKF